MTSKINRRWTAGAVVIAFAMMLGAILEGTFPTHGPAIAAEAPAATAPASASSAAGADLSTAFADLADRTIPAVVQIQVTMAGRRGAQDEELRRLPEGFRWFFGEPQEPGQGERRIAGGTGFLVSPDGYIVTNDHVAGDAEEIRVTLSDQRSFDAELVGTDPTTDVAVVKIDAKDLPYLTWGSSSALRVGSWVIAVGNPGFDDGQLESTVTSGIVSAKGRPLRLIQRGLQSDPRYGEELAGYAIENFIQTDAVINPGNSGGPMVDLAGQVVGMNTAIASTDGHYQGYGFAIPSDLVQKVASDLMAHGSVRRPWLGVQVVAVAPEDAEAFHLPAVTGVLVQAVTDGSPARDAGLKQGDVIVSIDGQPVGSGGDLQERVAVLDPGHRARVGYYRDGREREVEVRLGEVPGMEAAAHASNVHAMAGGSVMKSLGLTVQALDARSAEQLGFERAGGVVISEVDPTGPAATRGLAPGLRIERIGNREIRNPDDVADAVSKAGSGSVVTLVVEAPTGGSRLVNVRVR